MPADWKKVAAARHREIQRLRRELDERAERVGAVVRRELSIALHSRCLVSLSDERTKAALDDVADAVVRTLRPTH